MHVMMLPTIPAHSDDASANDHLKHPVASFPLLSRLSDLRSGKGQGRRVKPPVFSPRDDSAEAEVSFDSF